jgi:uncharacterized protein YutE (UPF0331/DUF86 family)
MTPSDPSVVRRKLLVIVENLKALEPVVTMPPQRYRDELFVRKATERLLQELIEAAIDVNTHILVQDEHGPPDDYYQGFIGLADHGVLSRDLSDGLAPSAGLRNRLVHEYDAIVDAIVLDAVRKAQTLFPQYVAAIERDLSNRAIR